MATTNAIFQDFSQKFSAGQISSRNCEFSAILLILRGILPYITAHMCIIPLFRWHTHELASFRIFRIISIRRIHQATISITSPSIRVMEWISARCKKSQNRRIFMTSFHSKNSAVGIKKLRLKVLGNGCFARCSEQ